MTLLSEELHPRSVVVFRALQLGDMLCAVPALRALRAALPNARITLVSLPWAKWFAGRFNHYVDEFISFPGYPGLPEQRPDVRAFSWFLAGLQARRFDLAIQMHGDGSCTNAVVALFGARQCAGFSKPGAWREAAGRYLDCLEEENEIRRLLQLTDFLGAPAKGEHLELPLDAADEAELGRFGVTAHWEPGSYVCLHPGARFAHRRWPARCFAEVGDFLHFEHGLQVVLTGSASEKDVTYEVSSAMRAPAIDAAGPISVGALATLLGRARMVVSNCTAASHIAAALKIPSVVVFVASEMRRWAPLNNRLHRAVWDPTGMHVGAVIGQARALLG